MNIELNANAILQSVIVATLLAVFAAAFSTYVEVKQMRRDLDRIEVYVDQMWKEK